MLEDFVLNYGNLGDRADNIDVSNCFKLNSKTSFIKSMILQAKYFDFCLEWLFEGEDVLIPIKIEMFGLSYVITFVPLSL